MKFKLIPIAVRTDGGSHLKVTAENTQEVVQLQQVCDVFDLRGPSGAIAYAEAINLGKSKHTRSRIWFPVAARLRLAFEPYAKLLETLTDWDSRKLKLDLSGVVPELGHQFVLTSLRLDAGVIHFAGFGPAEDTERKITTAQYAMDSMVDNLQEQLGYRPFEREFVQKGNGAYYPNPNYARHHLAAVPALGSGQLWRKLFNRWREHHATPGQKERLNKVDQLDREHGIGVGHCYNIREAIGSTDEGYVYGHVLYYEDATGPIDYDGKGKRASLCDWKKFKTL